MIGLFDAQEVPMKNRRKNDGEREAPPVSRLPGGALDTAKVLHELLEEEGAREDSPTDPSGNDSATRDPATPRVN
ncbi:hypothetical protein HY478_01760 [Candidatus Uhrbacteria bacterium]|nr:hypothetical protein [Candidatus Uhrbacteria bacterium]